MTEGAGNVPKLTMTERCRRLSHFLILSLLFWFRTSDAEAHALFDGFSDDATDLCKVRTVLTSCGEQRIIAIVPEGVESFFVTIAEEARALSPSELADFLYLFRAINVALAYFVPPHDHQLNREPSAGEIGEYRLRLATCSPEQLETFFDPTNAPESVQITEIRRQSPLEFVLKGSPFLLVLAVIFSGGSISLGPQGVKAKLPPFGKGLRSLKEALGLGKNLNVGFGIRPTTIKLNKQEYDELFKQSDDSRNKGGFQHFLVGLKDRVNKQTRELFLSERDLERIYRYKANPQKGGWQSRFKKIFGRHFPDDHGG